MEADKALMAATELLQIHNLLEQYCSKYNRPSISDVALVQAVEVYTDEGLDYSLTQPLLATLARLLEDDVYVTPFDDHGYVYEGLLDDTHDELAARDLIKENQ